MREIEKIEEIQNVLFDTLCYFDDFCRKNKIRYFISNGTLLGAAKYKGFIPWDDDADVMLPRKDYDRLVSLKEINNEKYRLFCTEQNENWRMPYAKLSCEQTLIKEGEYDFGESFGLSMDVFPIDNWSSCLLIAKMQAFVSECLKRLLVCSIGGDFRTQKKGIKRLILKSIWFMGKALGHKRIKKYILDGIAKSKRKNSRYAGCRVWTSHFTNEIFPSDFFDGADYLEIRGRAFPVFADYERYLRKLYGKWKEELPREQQHSNHEIRVWHKNAQ